MQHQNKDIQFTNQQRKIKGTGCHENRQKNTKQTTARYKANYLTQYSCKYMSLAPKKRTKSESSLPQTRTWYRVDLQKNKNANLISLAKKPN